MRVISLDVGSVRTGYAFGDTDLGVALCRKDVILSSNLIQFLEREFYSNPFEMILVGIPKNRDNKETEVTVLVNKMIVLIQTKFPHIKINKINERLTSKLAAKNIGNDKYLDNEAARIMLQEWLNSNGF